MEAPSQESVLVLDEDRSLGDVVPPEAQERARRESVAAVLSRPAGAWDGGRDSEIARGGFGLLVLGGVLVRRVGVGGRFGAELLADGDLLRPWQHEGAAEVLPFEMAWRIVAPVRLAVLDPPGPPAWRPSTCSHKPATLCRRVTAPTPQRIWSARSNSPL